MRRGKVLPALVLGVLFVGFLLPRPAPAISANGGGKRIAVLTGDDGQILSPRPPRRRVEAPAPSLPVHAAPSPSSPRLLQVPAAPSAGTGFNPVSIQPSSGAGVTRAGPSDIL